MAFEVANGRTRQGRAGGPVTVQPMEDEQLLERPGDVRSVPFRQRWAVATAGLGPRPLGPPVTLPVREKSLAPLAADAIPRDRALSVLSCRPSSVSLIQVSRGGLGRSPGLGCLEGCIPLQLRWHPGTLAPPCSARQLPSPWPGVTTRGGACVSVYELVDACACGCGARPSQPGAVVGCVAEEAGRAS